MFVSGVEQAKWWVFGENDEGPIFVEASILIPFGTLGSTFTLLKKYYVSMKHKNLFSISWTICTLVFTTNLLNDVYDNKKNDLWEMIFAWQS